MATSRFDLGADIGDYVKEVAKIPGITDAEAQKAGKAIRQRLVNEAVKGLTQVQKEAKDTVKEVGRAADKASDELGNQILDLGELIGVPGDAIKKFTSGLGALASPAGVAAVAVGSIAAAATGVAVGITSAVAASDDLARSIADIQGLTKQQGFGISREELKTIDEANAAMSALSTIGQQAVVTLGAEFAPAVKLVATELIKLGLAGLDAFNAFADGEDVLRAVAEFLAGRMVKAITAPINSLTLLTETMAKAAEIAGADGLAASLHSVNDAYEGWVDSMADQAVDQLGGGIERLTASTSDYDARAQALIGTMVRHAESQRNAAAAAKAQAEAERDAAKELREHEAAVKALIAEYDRAAMTYVKASETREERLARETADLDDLAEKLRAEGQLTIEREATITEAKKQLQAEYVEDAIRAAQTIGAQRLKDHEEEMKRIVAERDARVAAAWTATQQGVAAAQQLADLGYQIKTDAAESTREALEATDSRLTAAQRAELERRQKQEEQAAKRFFALSKALSLIQITVATAEGTQSAIAAGMKLGGPVAAALLAAGVIASGVAQAAIVASQKPPTAHRGRIPLSGGAADEQLTTVLEDEAVLTGRGVAAAGGPRGVADLNAGRGMGSGGSINLVLGNRTLERVTFEAMRQPGSSARAMARGSEKVGQRRRM